MTPQNYNFFLFFLNLPHYLKKNRYLAVYKRQDTYFLYFVVWQTSLFTFDKQPDRTQKNRQKCRSRWLEKQNQFKYCRSKNCLVSLQYQLMYAKPDFWAKLTKFCRLLMFLYLQGVLAKFAGKNAIAVYNFFIVGFLNFVSIFVVKSGVKCSFARRPVRAMLTGLLHLINLCKYSVVVLQCYWFDSCIRAHKF